MGKKTKLGLGIALVAAILIIAFVGAYFICMDNISKNTPSFSGETLSYEYDTGGDTPSTATMTVELDTGKVYMEFLVSTIYGGKFETVFSVTDGQVAIATAYGVEAIDDTGFSGMVGLPGSLTSDVSFVFTPADGGQNLKAIFDGGEGDDVVLIDVVVPQADLDKMIATGGIDPSQIPDAPGSTETEPSETETPETQPTELTVTVGELVYEYTNGVEGTPTTSTVIFDPATGKVSVTFLASSMYQGNYETAFTSENDQLVISTVEAVDATDISGMAAIVGLPEVLTSSINHVVESVDGGVKLTIWFDGGDGDDALLFEMMILQEDLDKLN